ncbi:MAG: agmatine deiminase family protein [Hyphomicrobiaceae bacterium]
MSDATIASERPSAKAAGFRVPLESDPHDSTFLQWPSGVQHYGGQRKLEAVQSKIALIAKTIAHFEPVIMLASPDQMQSAVAALGPTIAVWPIATDDLWCRDSGPTFVVSQDGRLAVVDFNFNGWGGKQSHDRDRKIARRVAEKLNLPVFSNGLVGEAGGVEVDGAGTAIAHESSWINRNRNRQSKTEIERLLLDALGAEQIIWTPGIKGADITDYHIDALARFVKPGQVVIQLGATLKRADRWSVAAFETYANLKSARDAHGRLLDIVVIPEPTQTRVRSNDFVASYVNYYVCNGAVIGANFGDDTADATASTMLRELYPGRSIVSLDIDPIAAAGGGIHCATQQKPAAKV